MMNPNPPSGCFSRVLNCCCCRRRQPEELYPPMTEEEKERFEYLENILPCRIYRKESDDNEEISYRLYDGFDDAPQEKPLSLRLHQEECSICLMEYEDGEKLTSSHNPKCQHAFHRECMKRWLVSNSECPCCRKGFLEFRDEDDDTYTNPLASQIAWFATSFQQQVDRIRLDIRNQLEPIILRLEQQREETIEPNDTTNPRRTHRVDGTHDTQFGENDSVNNNRPTRPSTRYEMDRIREGLSVPWENIWMRLAQKKNPTRGDDDSADPSPARSNLDYAADENNRQTPIARTTDHNLENGTRPDLLTATSQVLLEMGSARWKDVTRIVSQSFRGEAEFESSQTPPSESNSSPAT